MTARPLHIVHVIYALKTGGLENGLVNLAAIVGMLIFCISLVPLILLLGAPKKPESGGKPQS